MTQAAKLDPVEEEIKRLKKRLSAESTANKAASNAQIDAAEQLARTARDSRPGMSAVRQAVSVLPARKERLLEGDLTNKFKALRSR